MVSLGVGEPTVSLMIKALLLLFAPASTWDSIARAKRGVAYVLLTCVLPLLILSSAVEAYGLHHWGKWQGAVPHLKTLSVSEAIVFEAGQFVFTLLLIVINAVLLRSVGGTFHGRHTFAQAFTTVGYGLSPLFLARLLNAFSDVPPWLSWAVGIIVVMGILYHGVPKVMEPDPAHAFGLYLMSVLLLLLTTGLLALVTACFLMGKFPKLENIISAIAARLPF
jgi:hypothetical protein